MPEADKAVWAWINTLRDLLLATVVALLAWTVHEVYTLSNRVTAIESSRFTAQDAASLERRLADAIGSADSKREQSFNAIQSQLTFIATSLGELRGAQHEREAK